MGTEQMLHLILSKIDEFQTDFKSLKTDVHELRDNFQILKSDVQTLKTEVQELKSSNEAIKIQTAQLMEFRTDIQNQFTEFRNEINQKLDQLIDDIDFLKSKEYQNEKDLYKLKKVINFSE